MTPSTALSTLLDNVPDILRAWPDKPIHQHHEPSVFRELLTLPEVDDLIDNDCLAMRNVALLKDGRPVDTCLFADGDMPRRGYLRQHLADGGTISLRSLERLKPSLAELYRSLSAETGYRVHVNAYLTPAGEQGLRYHYDPYVTLILQVAGQKAWPTHPPFVENPVREFQSFHRVGFTPEQLHYLANTPPAETFTLSPGDVFWLPRGYVHAPYAVGPEPSLHITLALKERTWHWVAQQLAEDVLNHALSDPEMREAVPPAMVLGDPDRAAQEMRKYLIAALATLDPVEAASVIRTAALRIT